MEMNQMIEIGKISPEVFNELIFPRLGAKSGEAENFSTPLLTLFRGLSTAPLKSINPR